MTINDAITCCLLQIHNLLDEACNGCKDPAQLDDEPNHSFGLPIVFAWLLIWKQRLHFL